MLADNPAVTLALGIATMVQLILSALLIFLFGLAVKPPLPDWLGDRPATLSVGCADTSSAGERVFPCLAMGSTDTVRLADSRVLCMFCGLTFRLREQGVRHL